ncbi:hypothetical protein HPB48_022453 [Haemaphysalis longicornis]|uniref:Gustatory receptor n=1 Tax=Haemaphysalis longicornis TaxID=44386 RepID=A0A9J6G1R3_HAELO|nr:hypothetical protein HPB48_022453 [Haemaphysalis longicornis]
MTHHTIRCRRRHQQSHHAGQNKCSHMLKHFSVYWLLWRVCGCLFIQNFRDQSLRTARAKLATVYILCPVMWTALALVFEAAFIIGKAFLVSDSIHSFTKSLLFITQSILNVKIFLTFFCMVLGCRKILEFHRESALYERSTCFVPCENAEARRRRILAYIRRFAALVSLAATHGLGTQFYGRDLMLTYGKDWTVFFRICGALSLLVFLVYDSLMYIYLSHSSDILTEYLRAQLFTLQDVCRNRRHVETSQQAWRSVEKVRLNVYRILALKKSMNCIWHPALVISTGSLILLQCMILQAVFNGGFGQPELWIIASYCAYFLISFVDLATVSHSLMDQVSSFWGLLDGHRYR